MPSNSRVASDNLVQLVESMGLAAAHQAVVSPCSQCKNRRAVVEDGKPACPRYFWKRLVAEVGDADASYDPLLLTGSEGEDNESVLRNPVYSNSDHHILIWVATLRNNPATYDDNGKLLVPHLLDPAFDTDYIQCEQYPYVVRSTEAGYFQGGAYREGDQLETVGLRTQTMVGSDHTPVRIGGFAHKVDFAYNFNRQKVDKDLCPRGT